MKILIVDDEKYEAVLMEKCVDWRSHGFEIAGSAQSAADALEMFDVLRPDIVFCDINMPVVNGLELSRQMRERHEHVQIIIVTGYREFEYARTAIDIGVGSYVLKPIDPEELLRAARKAEAEIQKNEEDLYGANMVRNTLAQETIDYIEKHIAEQGLSLKDIAPALFVSGSYLSRRFKAETGENLTEYIFRRRMEKSRELVANTVLRVSEVAELVGMADTHYLGRCFKKFTGMTINEYRKKVKSGE